MAEYQDDSCSRSGLESRRILRPEEYEYSGDDPLPPISHPVARIHGGDYLKHVPALSDEDAQVIAAAQHNKAFERLASVIVWRRARQVREAYERNCGDFGDD